ncbi:hypothetical protein Salat_0162700 [Sesamum alatum]|uniref:Uncharacterized protein n=1 Tax=Sesamum alatum TaxID=300844 RepID=A0AAE1YWW1_9LAMI|nr:hypothetical protein Salat_0162700 [Sesamum alatum]
MFYNSRWTRDMEQTFVDSLVEHARSGLFHPDRPTIHAVMCSLYDVSKKQNDVIDADCFNLNVAAPQEGWVLLPPPRDIQPAVGAPNPAVVPVVVPDEAGATEPARDGPNTEPVPDAMHVAQAFDTSQVEPAPDAPNTELAPDAMHVAQALDALLAEPPHHAPQAVIAHVAPQAKPIPDDACPPKPVLYINDSSSESSSMRRALHEYNGSGNDVDSVLPPPGVPLWKRAKVAHHSPASQKSARASSSTASNATPLKKHE